MSHQHRRAVFSLDEVGTARIVFLGDYETFDGTLVNADDEYYGIYGRPAQSSGADDKRAMGESTVHALDEEMGAAAAAAQAQNNLLSPSVGTSLRHQCDQNNAAPAAKLFDVTIVEAETGCQYCLKRVQLRVDPHATSSSMSASYSQLNALGAVHALNNDVDHLMGSLGADRPVELSSEHMQFSSEEVLVGNRADVEIRQHVTPSLAGAALPVHMGRMTVRFQTALTPPPTPASSVVVADECSNQGADFAMADDSNQNHAQAAHIEKSGSRDDFMQ